jgi:hypothetical protein
MEAVASLHARIQQASQELEALKATKLLQSTNIKALETASKESEMMLHEMSQQEVQLLDDIHNLERQLTVHQVAICSTEQQIHAEKCIYDHIPVMLQEETLKFVDSSSKIIERMQEISNEAKLHHYWMPQIHHLQEAIENQRMVLKTQKTDADKRMEEEDQKLTEAIKEEEVFLQEIEALIVDRRKIPSHGHGGHSSASFENTSSPAVSWHHESTGPTPALTDQPIPPKPVTPPRIEHRQEQPFEHLQAQSRNQSQQARYHSQQDYARVRSTPVHSEGCKPPESAPEIGSSNLEEAMPHSISRHPDVVAGGVDDRSRGYEGYSVMSTITRTVTESVALPESDQEEGSLTNERTRGADPWFRQSKKRLHEDGRIQHMLPPRDFHHPNYQRELENNHQNHQQNHHQQDQQNHHHHQQQQQQQQQRMRGAGTTPSAPPPNQNLAKPREFHTGLDLWKDSASHESAQEDFYTID